MNIKISDSWLQEFIDTKATPKQIGECLTLCSQSVEKIIDDHSEKIYDIEITTNRPDCLSVYGIARELAAVLPRFNIPAQLKKIPVLNPQGLSLQKNSLQKKLPLQVKIVKPDLCPRFTALIFDNIKIKPSPKYAQERLNLAGIRALNNVVDISNYLMLEIGQPMHTFDYDKILKHKMILRESKAGEEIITLDGQKRKLKEGIIIIEDGEGRIVDLCGIMGAKNSETDENTKKVLLFVQTYNPMKIRRACQAMAFHTEAASRFEKGLDPEGVIPAMQRATLLFDEWCEGKVASQLFDIYPNPVKQKTVSLAKAQIDNLMGIDFKLEEAKTILESLGFEVKTQGDSLAVKVPHWRNGDIDIPEDLVEEIARIYGYHNLPNVLPPITSLNFQKDPVFDWEDKIKNALKYWGFTEVMSYSLVSKDLTIPSSNPLKIANPLTEELLYLRTSLIPSLLKIIAKNQAGNKEIKIFEMANIYQPRGSDELPDERMKLCLAIFTQESGNNLFLTLKGFCEALLQELGIYNSSFNPDSNIYKYMLLKTKSADISVQNQTTGTIGEINQKTLKDFDINGQVATAELDLNLLLSSATKIKKYTPLPKYPPIIEDLSFIFSPRTPVGPVIEEIKKIDEIIREVELIDSYKNTKTFRITYQNRERNLTDEEVTKIRVKVVAKINQKYGGDLKT